MYPTSILAKLILYITINFLTTIGGWGAAGGDRTYVNLSQCHFLLRRQIKTKIKYCGRIPLETHLSPFFIIFSTLSQQLKATTFVISFYYWQFYTFLTWKTLLRNWLKLLNHFSDRKSPCTINFESTFIKKEFSIRWKSKF